MDLRRSLVEKKLSSRSKSASKTASKQGSRANSNYGTDDEYETDDNMSVMSIDSNESFNEANSEQNWEVAFNECIEAIIERKGSSVQSREDLLSKLIKFMSVRMTARELGNRDRDLVNAISKILKGARSEKEAVLCAKALAILYITKPDNDEIYSIADNALKGSLQSSPYLVAKAACLTSIGCMILIFQSIPPAQAHIEAMVEIIENDGNTINAQDDSLVVSSAEDSLAVASTLLAGHEPMEDVQLAAPSLIEQLDSVDPRVRSAAGEALALLFELTAVDPDDEDALAAYANNPPVDDVHHLTKLLADLATTSSKKQSKLSRREQHHTFREVLATVSSPTSHSAPAETVRFGKGSQVLYVTTWLQLTRLNHLRQVLGSGLQIHLKKNGFVRRILQYDGPAPPDSDDDSEPEDDLSKDLKNSINQEIRKQRHKDRSSDRKEKSAMSSSFLAEEDD
ncbi:Uncharacterized protein C20F10.03 [Taphrina deformans PYCC 5710]|uniref:Uncharacterized protein C20F10.03 n=1 Tax=Taphrina deformans (strain PYCC 5710 / ATCC 11124 / CBS 356.35 / IMI 108563 / JCM 9778 / NBRC 8474) TaxID=1097556 RepID=R4XAY0_TAPDE|nr:Uncharacterized protein C20F10.03 [Taphrina deformans PYCC 5710]|eukprot:CCG83024.1 Uncharacterized protein C20F10.03 [Taphrina deformans PYCC 5710]